MDGKEEANGGRWDAQDEQQEEEEEPGEERGTVKRRGCLSNSKNTVGSLWHPRLLDFCF